jgi:endoglucanase
MHILHTARAKLITSLVIVILVAAGFLLVDGSHGRRSTPYISTDAGTGSLQGDADKHTGYIRFGSGGTGTPTKDPLAGQSFYVQTGSHNDAARAATANPKDAKALDVIAKQSTAYWVIPENPDATNESIVEAIETAATLKKQTPVFVIYGIPYRDCGSYSSGGEASDASYDSFVNYVKAGIAGRKAIVIVEPDALVQSATYNCAALTPALITDRLNDIKYASDTLSVAGTDVYLDAGSPNSQGSSNNSLSFIVPKLITADISKDAGFELDTSSDLPTSVEQTYGDQVSAALATQGAPNKHYTIDTSRNGNGTANNPTGSYCNLPGLALGHIPSSSTDNPLNDAYLWVKYPGESDGKCRGAGVYDANAPQPGIFWPDYAIGLVHGDSPAPKP